LTGHAECGHRLLLCPYQVSQNHSYVLQSLYFHTEKERLIERYLRFFWSDRRRRLQLVLTSTKSSVFFHTSYICMYHPFNQLLLIFPLLKASCFREHHPKFRSKDRPTVPAHIMFPLFILPTRKLFQSLFSLSDRNYLQCLSKTLYNTYLYLPLSLRS
jgi:hypothetical protein